MIQIKVLSFNALDSLSSSTRSDKLIDLIKSVNPDIAFISEAASATVNPDKFKPPITTLAKLGYRATIFKNNDYHDRSDAHYSMGLTKLGIALVVKGSERQAYQVKLKVGDRTLSLIGQHFDDRNETYRLNQLQSLPNADILMGDFNAMHGKDKIAKTLRSIKPITNTWPDVSPDFSVIKSPIKQFISLSERLTRMADGRLINNIENLGLIEADPKHQPTIHHLAQLDHIMIGLGIKPTEFRVMNEVKLSDHKPIMATLVIDD